ncbi:recombinase family protein [bacterium]|nr:recombinase family protein [bacterium]
MLLRVTCLYRVSTTAQADHNDIPMQREACHEYARAHGLWIIKEYQERGISAFKTPAEDRDALQKLREDALEKRFDILLVFMFDRIGRRSDETPFVVEWFIKHGIRVISVKEGEQILDSHTDRLLNYIRYWQGEGESKNTALRIQTRLRQMHQEGYYTGGPVAYGYCLAYTGRRNKKGQPVQDLMICDEEAAIVKEIFARTVSEQIGTTTLANDLSQRGLRTRAGAKFQCRTIKSILQNRAYLGYIIKRDVASPHIPILQIIDETTFEKANQILSSRFASTVQRRSIPRKGKPALLSGILFCGSCGHRLSTSRPAENSRRNKTQYVCPICRKPQLAEHGQSTYTAEIVDSMILRHTAILLDLFTAHSEDSLRKTLEKKRKAARQRLQEEKDRLESAKAELSKRENEVVRVLDGRSQYTAKELSALIHEQNTICNRLSGWVDRLNDQNQHLQYISRNLSFLYATVLSWKRILPTAAEEEQRKILRELYQRVEIRRGYAINLNLISNYSFFRSCIGKTKKSVCSVKL